jgi:hypothetical protein
MLTRRLPKTLRSVFFALGMTMITATIAIERFQAVSAADIAASQSGCPTEQVAGIVKALLAG